MALVGESYFWPNQLGTREGAIPLGHHFLFVRDQTNTTSLLKSINIFWKNRESRCPHITLKLVYTLLMDLKKILFQKNLRKIFFLKISGNEKNVHHRAHLGFYIWIHRRNCLKFVCFPLWLLTSLITFGCPDSDCPEMCDCLSGITMIASLSLASTPSSHPDASTETSTTKWKTRHFATDGEGATRCKGNRKTWSVCCSSLKKKTKSMSVCVHHCTKFSGYKFPIYEY